MGTLVLIDSNGGTFYSVTWDGNEMINRKQSDGIEKVTIGECSITSCPQNYTLFELDIGTDNYAEDFSWELVNTNNTVLAYGNNYEDANKYYYYRECVQMTNNECGTLQLIDSFGDGGTFYSVTWDGNGIVNTKQSDDIDKVKIGDCVVLCGKVVPSTCGSVWSGHFFGIELNTYYEKKELFTIGNRIVAGGVTYYVDAMQHHNNCNSNVGLVYIANEKECAEGAPWRLTDGCGYGGEILTPLNTGDDWCL